MKTRAFTLIELLIVVAIIAILAAIAVPNFLEAQVRSKVSRGKADMRSIATALESYRTDYTHYPEDQNGYMERTGINPFPDWFYALNTLTAPVAYITSVPNNVFEDRLETVSRPLRRTFYKYFAEGWKKDLLEARGSDPLYQNATSQWSLASVGPDLITNYGEYMMFGEETLNSITFEWPVAPGVNAGPGCLYDPTNGTVSKGDIVRVGP